MYQIVGHGDLELFTEKLNLKRAHHGGENPLHQDYPYWIPVADNAAEVATTIIFLDDATIENGCLWVVPGSHKDGRWANRTDGDAFAANEVDASAYPDMEVIPSSWRPGRPSASGPSSSTARPPTRPTMVAGHCCSATSRPVGARCSTP
jgi:Phytanoyl-CoA dioxygenase (PhyH)